MSEKETKKQNVLGGAIVLVVATALVKVIGAIYKIPLTSIIGSLGRGYFASAYPLHLQGRRDASSACIHRARE